MKAAALPRRRGFLITFSGLDGSGKSTQIDRLRAALAAQGCRTRVLQFWDDVVVLRRWREGFVHKVFGSEQGVGAPGRPVRRRDKNMRGWHLALARHLLYLLDAVSLRLVVRRARHSADDFIIMDRYLYDELANLPLGQPASRAFARCLLWLAPRPELSLLLDADPAAAATRKPEYPVEFMQECRQWYLRLAHLAGITIVPAMPLERVAGAVQRALAHTMGRPAPPSLDTVQAA